MYIVPEVMFEIIFSGPSSVLGGGGGTLLCSG
jgi:hypothetical protein